jgi:REP element-mobilizing transposase RayT
MVLASHVIFTAYAFWLPNDPRGSWSEFVRKWELLRFGPATKVETRRSVAHVPHNRGLRLAAKKVLDFPPVVFNGIQALAIAQGFKNNIRKTKSVVLACSIMPTHVHMVLLRHHYRVEYLANFFKGEATKELMRQGLHPMRDLVKPGADIPSPWTRRPWKVFLDSEEDIIRAINYVKRNPEKEGKRPQNWTFVTDFEALKRRPLDDR